MSIKNVSIVTVLLFSAVSCVAGGRIVLLPDTQYYSNHNDGTYEKQAQWMADNQVSRAVEMVVHLGDITHNNTIREWDVAKSDHSLLDNHAIRYTMLPGNHDNPYGGRKRDTRRYNQYFGVSHFEGSSW